MARISAGSSTWFSSADERSGAPIGAAAAAVSSPAAARGQLAGAVVISNEAIPQIGIYKSRHLASDTMLAAGLRCDGTSRMIKSDRKV